MTNHISQHGHGGSDTPTGGGLHTVLAEQVLAALVAAPASVAEKHAQRIEPGDFQDWRHRKIFAAFTQCVSPDHSEAGSLITQINRHLLESGAYQDRDNGLRAAVIALAEVRGHAEQLNVFTTELLQQRFRRALVEHATALAEHAEGAPLDDVAEKLNETIKELRRLWSRIHTQNTLHTVKETAA